MQLRQQLESWKRNLARNMEQAGIVLEAEMTDIVAQDTRKLERSIASDPVIIGKTFIEVKVGPNNVEYAQKVEEGEGKTYRYKRYKPGSNNPDDRNVVWVGVGMQFMQRALENKTDEIIGILNRTQI